MEDARIALMRKVFADWKARDFEALMKLTHPQISAELVLPPGSAAQTYDGEDAIQGFLSDGDRDYEYFEADAEAFDIGPTGRVFAEGTVSYRKRGGGGMSSVAFWACEIKDDKIVAWQSFSDRGRARAAAGL